MRISTVITAAVAAAPIAVSAAAGTMGYAIGAKHPGIHSFGVWSFLLPQSNAFRQTEHVNILLITRPISMFWEPELYERTHHMNAIRLNRFFLLLPKRA